MSERYVRVRRALAPALGGGALVFISYFGLSVCALFLLSAGWSETVFGISRFTMSLLGATGRDDLVMLKVPLFWACVVAVAVFIKKMIKP